MKTIPFIVCAVLNTSLTYTATGQSSFGLANNNPPLVNAPVFDAQGVPLAGANYLAELWGAATPDSLTPLVVLEEGNTREIVPFIVRGYFFSGVDSLSVLSVPRGGWAWLQVRAWDARLGATYEEAVSRGLGGYGESPLFYAQGSDPLDLLGLPAPLIGLESFSLRGVIPEPSAALLLLLGLPLLFWHRHRSK